MGPGRVEGRWGNKASAGTDPPRPTRTRGDKSASLTTVFGRKIHDREQVDRAAGDQSVTKVTAHIIGVPFPGADVERIRASKDFLRHQGASRDSQRTGLTRGGLRSW